MRKAFYIVSTHWDREWYEPLQGFRMRLVHLLDEVFDVLEKDPKFASFEMDGQVLPILDYLEVRTKAGERVRRLSREGRFRIGPWFALPDEWLVSGESLVRNLQVGLAITKEYESPRPLTAPMIDEFGHVSQMPQILAQFGFIGTFLHRGINLKDSEVNFRWQSPDGSSVLSHRLAKAGYGTMQIYYRRTLEADEPFDFDRTVDLFVKWALGEAERNSQGPILLLDTCDHVEIEPHAPEILIAANKRLKEHGIKVEHLNSDVYFEEIARTFASTEKPVKGELRDTLKEAEPLDSGWLIQGVLSSRVRLKQDNARCEDELCLWAEPFGAFAATSVGLPYPAEFLALSWRHLLENHAHDSICGCSIDQVHKDMEYRFDQSIGISQRLTEASLTAIARASAPAKLPKDSLVLTIFNPTAQEITTPTDLEIRLPLSWPEKFQEFLGYEEKFGFKLTDTNGAEISWQLNGQERDQKSFRRPYRKIPTDDSAHGIRVTAMVPIPAFGYTTLVVEPVPGPVRFFGSLRTSANVMENEFLRVQVDADGTITLADKRSGASYSGLFSYEDNADIGDGWFWGPAVNDRVITSTGAAWTLSVEADGAEKTTFQITTRMMVPGDFDFKKMERSPTAKEMIITNRLTLRKGSDTLESAIEVENQVDDHRLRVHFPTHLKADHYWSDSAFDVVKRPIALVPDNVRRKELDVDGRPQQSWTALEDGTQGLAVISRGLYESGVIERPDRPLFVTLVRGFRKAVFSGDNMGGQSRGKHSFRLELNMFKGDVPLQKLFVKGQQVLAPVRYSRLMAKELDQRPHVTLPGTHQFLSVEGDVVVTSLQLERENCWAIRLFNPTERDAAFTLGGLEKIATVSAHTLSGEDDKLASVAIQGAGLSGSLKPKRISTLLVELSPSKA